MNHDVNSEIKVERLYGLLFDPDTESLFSDFEKNFIKRLFDTWQATNYEPSEKEERIIDEIYEKAWQKDLFD